MDLKDRLDLFIIKADMSIAYQNKTKQISDDYFKRFRRPPTQKEIALEMKKIGKSWRDEAMIRDSKKHADFNAKNPDYKEPKETPQQYWAQYSHSQAKSNILKEKEIGNNGEEQTKPEDRIDEAEYQYGREGERDIDKEVEPNPVRGSGLGSCPNKMNHVSGSPAFDREKCPHCDNAYVSKPIKKGLHNPFDDPKTKRLKHFKDVRNRAVREEGKKILKSQSIKKSFDDELAQGIKVEMEHKDTIDKIAPNANLRETAEQIARDHLKERPDYYSQLKVMEDKLVKKSETTGFFGDSPNRFAEWECSDCGHPVDKTQPKCSHCGNKTHTALPKGEYDRRSRAEALRHSLMKKAEPKIEFGKPMSESQRAKAHLQIHARAIYGDKKPKEFGELNNRIHKFIEKQGGLRHNNYGFGHLDSSKPKVTPHCESCGRENPNVSDGYTTCCNELVCDGSNESKFGTPERNVTSHCWAHAEKEFKKKGWKIPEGSYRLSKQYDRERDPYLRDRPKKCGKCGESITPNKLPEII
jgi:hypothetical protein